ncbi:hypothetical protein J7L05_00035 [bacterium]|nr:hypothetical protein [bacterium]
MENNLRTALVIYTVILTVAIAGCASTKQLTRHERTISTNGHYFDVNPKSGEIAVVTNHSVDFYSPFNHRLVHSVEIPSSPTSKWQDYFDKVLFSKQGNQLYVLGWKDISIIDVTTHELILCFEDVEFSITCYDYLLRILPAEKKESVYFIEGFPDCTGDGILKKINIKNNRIENDTRIDRYGDRIVLNDEQTKLYCTYRTRPGWSKLKIYDPDSLEEIGEISVTGGPKELINGRDNEIILSYISSGFAVINTQTDEIVNSFDIDKTHFGDMAFDKNRNILFSPFIKTRYHPEAHDSCIIASIDFNSNSMSSIDKEFRFNSQIALSPDGNTLYVLSGVVIHCIDLKNYNPEILVK